MAFHISQLQRGMQQLADNADQPPAASLSGLILPIVHQRMDLQTLQPENPSWGGQSDLECACTALTDVQPSVMAQPSSEAGRPRKTVISADRI